MRVLFLASAILLFSLAVAVAAQESQAEKYFTEGIWKKAVAEYEALTQSDRTVENLNRLGQAYFYANDFRASEEAFSDALKVGDTPDSRILLAMVKAVRDRGKLDDLEAMTDEYGENPLLLRSIGAALLHHKLHDEAMGYLIRARDADPEDYMTYFYIGLVQERKHQYDDCMLSYKESVQINPRFAQAVNNLGYCYKERHYYTYAIIEYEAAVAIEPDNPNFHYNLGNAQTHKDMIPEALEQYKRAVELDPEFAKAHYNLGRSYVGLDKLEEGMAELKLYIKYFDKSLLAIGAPHPRQVREEIKMIEDMIKDKEEGRDMGKYRGEYQGEYWE